MLIGLGLRERANYMLEVTFGNFYKLLKLMFWYKMFNNKILGAWYPTGENLEVV